MGGTLNLGKKSRETMSAGMVTDGCIPVRNDTVFLLSFLRVMSRVGAMSGGGSLVF